MVGEEDLRAHRALRTACILDGFILLHFLLISMIFSFCRDNIYVVRKIWFLNNYAACIFASDGYESSQEVLLAWFPPHNQQKCFFFFKTFDGWLFIETFQIMSGVKNLKGAKKEDLRALQAIWNAPVSEPEFEDKRMYYMYS